MARTRYIRWDDNDTRFILDLHAELYVYIVLVHWKNFLCVEMSLHSNTLSWFRSNQSLLLLLKVVCLAEKQQIPIL